MSYQELETSASEAVAFLSRDEPRADFNRDPNAAFADWLSRAAGLTQSPGDPSHSAIAEPVASREITFEGTLRISGYVAGTIRSSEGSLIVDPEGEVDADIFVRQATIHGRLRGEIRAEESVLIGASARVIGDIDTVALSIEPGAVFKGRCIFREAPVS